MYEYYGVFRRSDNGMSQWAWRKAVYPSDDAALRGMQFLILKTKEGNSPKYFLSNLTCGKRVVHSE